MSIVNVEQSGHGDPFRCYVGSRVAMEAQPYVVECRELHGRHLLFRLRNLENGSERRISMLELLALIEQPSS